jgi:hypothetical protein
MYARYGDFGKGGAVTMAGGIGPASETAEFLQRAGNAASVLNPNRGSGQLYGIVKWLQNNVELTGSSDANEALADRLGDVRESKVSATAKKRQTILSRISGKGMDYPNKSRLIGNDRIIRTVDEWISLAERDHTLEGSAGGTDYTDSEVDYEKRLNLSLLGSLRDRKGLLSKSLGYVSGQRTMLDQQLDVAPDWKRGAIRKGITNARETLVGLRSSWEELVGLTGRGGRIGEVKAVLADLGYRDTVEKESAASRDQLLSDLTAQQLLASNRALAVSQAQLPIFQQFLPKYHSGGVIPGSGEQPVMVRGGEGVFTPEQMSAMGNQPVYVTVVVEDGAVDANRIRAVVSSSLSDAVSKGRRAGSSVKASLPS